MNLHGRRRGGTFLCQKKASRMVINVLHGKKTYTSRACEAWIKVAKSRVITEENELKFQERQGKENIQGKALILQRKKRGHEKRPRKKRWRQEA